MFSNLSSLCRCKYSLAGDSSHVIVSLFSLFDQIRTLVISPSSVASICPTNKSEKSCEYTNLDLLLQGMRCAIVALLTFLVVAAFNPVINLLNLSPKLGSIRACGIAFVEVSSLLQFDALEC
jgi:hypothetical protein